MLFIQEYLKFSRLLWIFFFNSRKLVDGMLLIQEYLMFSTLLRIFFFIQEN